MAEVKALGGNMVTYDIAVHCKDCGKDHPVLLRIDLEGGPDQKRSIAEIFRGRSLPPQIKAIRGHAAFCYKTGRRFQLEKEDDIFLIPPTYFRRYPVTQ